MHRIFLAPLRADVDPARAIEHWTDRHGSVFSRTPGLRGYVQNRPLPTARNGQSHVCAEAWFDDRAAERAAFDSDYYRAEVTTDEARFVHRDAAWSSSATEVRTADHPMTYRVLVFGQTSHSASALLDGWDASAVDEYELRHAPLSGARPAVLGLWTDDVERASGIAARFGPLSMVTAPVAVVAPEQRPWLATAPVST